MTTSDGKKIADLIERRNEGSTDHYLLANFSRIEDEYMVWFSEMDAGDALLIIKGLINHYKLSAEVIAQM